MTQYGVRFHDGSVRHPWNGRTAELRARQELTLLKATYARDRFELVTRPGPDEPWEHTHDWDSWDKDETADTLTWTCPCGAERVELL